MRRGRPVAFCIFHSARQVGAMCCTYQAAGRRAGRGFGKGRTGPTEKGAADSGRCPDRTATGSLADWRKKAVSAGCETAADINNDAKMQQINLCIER